MPNLTKKPQQQDLFQVHNTFFVFISALVLDGVAARLQKKCSASLAVLCCLKASADYQTGFSSMGVSLLSKQAGCSRVSVVKAIAVLEEEGLLRVVRAEKGKRHVYQLFDKFAVRKEGQQTGTLKVPYLPRQVSNRFEDIAVFRQSGELPARALEAGAVYNIQININNYYGDRYERTSSVEGVLKELSGMKNNPMKRFAVEALRRQVEALEEELSTEA